MPEQQNIEYKSSWHDDYLKWVCGFAMNRVETLEYPVPALREMLLYIEK